MKGWTVTLTTREEQPEGNMLQRVQHFVSLAGVPPVLSNDFRIDIQREIWRQQRMNEPQKELWDE